MIYTVLRFLVGFALKVWFRQIVVLNLERFEQNRPILLAVNHPNSALDAIILACVLNRPLHFLARGDAFNHPTANWFLRKINLLPVYRFSEGFENLEKNNDTFLDCYDAFKKNAVILIFPEGSHSHQRVVRPLKKGTAKLALQSVENGVQNLMILPVTLNYTSLIKAGGKMFIQLGKAIEVNDFYELYRINKPKGVLRLNQQLFSGLNEIYLPNIAEEIPSYSTKDEFYTVGNKSFLLLKLFAVIGLLMNYLPYYFSKKVSQKAVKTSEFMATVRFVSLFVFSGIYYLIILLFVSIFLSFWIGVLAILVCLFTGYCLVNQTVAGQHKP